MDDIAEALRNTTEDGADPDLIYRAAEEIERLREDAVRLDWLEQHAWATERECFDFVDAWRTPDGRRHGGGLRYVIDAAMTPNDRVEGRDAASSRRVPSHDGLAPEE